jgi:hypothetical protein
MHMMSFVTIQPKLDQFVVHCPACSRTRTRRVTCGYLLNWTSSDRYRWRFPKSGQTNKSVSFRFHEKPICFVGCVKKAKTCLAECPVLANRHIAMRLTGAAYPASSSCIAHAHLGPAQLWVQCNFAIYSIVLFFLWGDGGPTVHARHPLVWLRESTPAPYPNGPIERIKM